MGNQLLEVSKLIAEVMKLTFQCGGISFRQHNEPDGDQDTWHYHMHVFPRYKNDRLYFGAKNKYDPAERIQLAQKLSETINKMQNKSKRST